MKKIILFLFICTQTMCGMELPSPLHREKMESREIVFKFLSELEKKYKEQADTAALLSRHNPEVEAEVKRSGGQYTAQADWKSIDPVFFDPVFIKQVVDKAPIWVNDKKDAGLIYAQHKMCILNLAAKTLQIRIMQHKRTVKAIAFAKLNGSNKDIIFGDDKGNICTFDKKTSAVGKLGYVDGEIIAFACSEHYPLIGVRFMPKEENWLRLPTAAIACIKSTHIQSPRFPFHDIPDIHGVTALSFDGQTIVTTNAEGNQCKWKLEDQQLMRVFPESPKNSM